VTQNHDKIRNCCTIKWTLESIQTKIVSEEKFANLLIKCVCFTEKHPGCGWIGPLKLREGRKSSCPEDGFLSKTEVSSFF
jgi:hypothetical protein